MIYANFDFYQTEFFGRAIDIDDFDRLALRASTFMDYYTLGKTAKYAELQAVKMCCCALVEQFARVEKAASNHADGQELKSQTVGPWTKTYASSIELETEARKRLASIIQEYLGHTGLLYRGVNGCVSSCCDIV